MEDINSLFHLNPEITHLNHGSFGACPKPIFDDYQKWQLELEQDAMNFFIHTGPKYLKQARESLGNFINCNGDDVVFTTNPSYAINIIAKSLQLQTGDEILATDIEYGAMDRTWNYYCKKSGAKFIRQHISLPISSTEQVVEDFFKGLTPNTKAIFISHLTSSTALKLPVAAICKRAKDYGLLTIVDGAHIPGQLELDLQKIEVDVYTGACHKWLLTPKGCSFLYVKKELQELYDPLIISWGYESAHPSDSLFLDYHEYQGTRDFSAFLTVPKAIQFRAEHNWAKISESCVKLVLDNYADVCGLFRSAPICPVNTTYLGQMCSIPVQTTDPIQLQFKLFEKYKIQTPIFVQDAQTYLRFSINGYNSQGDIEKLKNAIVEIKRTTALIDAKG